MHKMTVWKKNDWIVWNKTT